MEQQDCLMLSFKEVFKTKSLPDMTSVSVPAGIDSESSFPDYIQKETVTKYETQVFGLLLDHYIKYKTFPVSSIHINTAKFKK